MAHSRLSASHGLSPAIWPALRLQKHVGEKHDSAEGDDAGTAGSEQVQRAPAHLKWISVDAPRHAFEAEDVHREEGEIEADEENPEIQFSERFVHHAPGHFREPVIKRAE